MEVHDFNRKLLDLLTDDEDCDFEFNALEDYQLKGGNGFKHKGNWECMDNEDVEHLNKVWREGRAFGRSEFIVYQVLKIKSSYHWRYRF